MRKHSGALQFVLLVITVIGYLVFEYEEEEDPRWDEMHYGPLAEEYRIATGVPDVMDRSEFLHHFPKVFCGWAARPRASRPSPAG